MEEIKGKRIAKLKQKIQELEKEPSFQEDPKTDLLNSILHESSTGGARGAHRTSTPTATKEKRKSSQSIHRSFYYDALSRAEAQSQVEDYLSSMAKAKANLPKVSKSSLEVLGSGISRRLAAAILSIDPKYTKQLSFAHVGYVLSSMGLFRVQQFGSDLSQTSPQSRLAATKSNFLADDNLLHSSLFNLLKVMDDPLQALSNEPKSNGNAEQALSQNDRSWVTADNLYLLLNTLLCPTLGKVQKFKKLEDNFLSRFLKENVDNDGKAQTIKQQRQGFLAHVGEIYRAISKVEKQRLFAKTAVGFSPSRARGLQPEEKEITFRPSINEKSILLDKSKTKELMNYLDKPPSESVTRADLMRLRELSREQRLEAERHNKALAEEQECTFHPQVRHPARSLTRSRSQKSGITETLKTKRQLLEDERLRIERGKAEREIEECTFTPKISSFKSEIFHLSRRTPKDYDKAVGRLRTANKERAERKQALEHIPRGETYEFWRSQPIDPPRCALNYKIRAAAPFITLKIKVANDRVGTMALRIDDDPSVKARDFAVAFQVPVETEQKLVEVIQGYIDQEVQRILRERPLSKSN